MDTVERAIDRFARAARGHGLDVGDEQRDLLTRSALWLASLAHASGVSAYDTVEFAVMRGMAPALAYFEASAGPRCGRLADIGAGNGAVGATIAILEQNLVVDLVDRAQRAYTAGEILAGRLALDNLQPIQADVRALPSAEYDAAVFRALARGERALALVRPIVRPSGFIGAFHRHDDVAFGPGMGSIERLGSWATLVEGLVLTGYRV